MHYIVVIFVPRWRHNFREIAVTAFILDFHFKVFSDSLSAIICMQ